MKVLTILAWSKSSLVSPNKHPGQAGSNYSDAQVGYFVFLCVYYLVVLWLSVPVQSIDSSQNDLLSVEQDVKLCSLFHQTIVLSFQCLVCSLHFLCIIWLFFGCQYQHNRLSGKTRPRNNLLL